MLTRSREAAKSGVEVSMKDFRKNGMIEPRLIVRSGQLTYNHSLRGFATSRERNGDYSSGEIWGLPDGSGNGLSLGFGIPGCGGVVFVKLVAEGADADIEQFCRVGAVALAPLERREDVALFQLCER